MKWLFSSLPRSDSHPLGEGSYLLDFAGGALAGLNWNFERIDIVADIISGWARGIERK